MKNHEFVDLVKWIYLYLNRKTPPAEAQIEIWFQDLSYIETKAIDYIKDFFRDTDTIPRNLPKKIRQVHAEYSRKNNITYIVYDQYDDPRYPIEHLHTAFELLLAGKEDRFDNYCRANYMPTQDIERVENKVKMVLAKNLEFKGNVETMLKNVTKPADQKLLDHDRNSPALWDKSIDDDIIDISPAVEQKTDHPGDPDEYLEALERANVHFLGEGEDEEQTEITFFDMRI